MVARMFALYDGGCGFDLHIRQHLFLGDFGHEIVFYGYSLPTADSCRTIVSYWRMAVHTATGT